MATPSKTDNEFACVFPLALSDPLPETCSRTSIWNAPPLPPEELARRERDALRLKEEFSSSPWHSRRAEQDPHYWRVFLMSMVNAYSDPE